jgi:flavin prenyltransferase
MKRVIVGICGASGAIYGIRLLEALRGIVETHLIITAYGSRVIACETDYPVAQVRELASRVYDNSDLGASLASGTFPVDGMVVAPCSIKTLSAIAHSYADTLLVRAADVTLKEGRRLVLAVRETPLHQGHLALMSAASAAGAIICPPIPAFYHNPASIDDIVLHTVGKMMDLLGRPHTLYKRWQGGALSRGDTRH